MMARTRGQLKPLQQALPDALPVAPRPAEPVVMLAQYSASPAAPKLCFHSTPLAPQLSCSLRTSMRDTHVSALAAMVCSRSPLPRLMGGSVLGICTNTYTHLMPSYGVGQLTNHRHLQGARTTGHCGANRPARVTRPLPSIPMRAKHRA